ncbi:hypothetical protein V6N13_002163 [Hibiscus sabdariffa]|uniref:Uncharacterized protein n=1 Tax=Hibiscus sabdariffa TaxID=183260 RepID=A0ABR2C2B0_9ROSI
MNSLLSATFMLSASLIKTPQSTHINISKAQLSVSSLQFFIIDFRLKLLFQGGRKDGLCVWTRKEPSLCSGTG